MDQSVINRIVKATGVQKGELVLVHFWGEDEDVAIMHRFADAVASLGAAPLELQQSRTGNLRRFSAAQSNSYAETYFAQFSHVDAVLDVFNYAPVQLDQKPDAEHMAYYREYMAELFKRLMQARRFSQIRLPSEQNAQESGLPPEEFRERMLAAYDVDYPEIGRTAHKKIAQLAGKQELLLITPGGHALRFGLAGRQWLADAGDGDMPCGEIYIAPVEAETRGTVYFEKLCLEDVGVFDRVVLTVDRGAISGSSHDGINEYLSGLETADKTICELGFGLNPQVTSLCGYTVLDEKASGTFHIAIGTKKMFGGNNESAIHVDLVGSEFSIN